MAASSNVGSAAGEGLHYVQEGLEPVSEQQLTSYSAFSSYPTDGPTPVNSFGLTGFQERRGSHDENVVSSYTNYAKTRPSDLPVDPKGWRKCRVQRRILLWCVPLGLMLSWLVAGLVGYKIRQANKHRLGLLHNGSEDSSSSTITRTVTATTTMTATISLASAATATSTTTATVDMAGCPANNGTTYTSGAYTYIRICGLDFVGADIQNAFEPSFEACMDSCTAYNTAHTDNATCIGVSYDIYNPTDFSKNERCFLKNGKGAPTASVSDGKTCDSALIVSV
ncbi:hypothetical protein ACMFMG_000498 [Clarireedia jacksonii]